VGDGSWLARFDIETRPDGTRVHLIAVAGSGRTSVFAVVAPPPPAPPSVRTGLFAPWAIRSPLGILLDRLPERPIETADLHDLGLFGSVPGFGLTLSLDGVSKALAGHSLERLQATAPRMGRPSHPLLGFASHHGLDLNLPRFPVDGSGVSVPNLADPNVVLVGPAEREACLPAATVWTAELARTLLLDDGLLHEGTWSPDAYVYYAEPSPIGAWRRQAATLQPAFAAAILRDPVLRERVDAGRPFEDRLLDRVRMAIRNPEGLTAAKLRRLRALRRPLTVDGYGNGAAVLSVLSFLPLRNVPRSPEGWAAFIEDGLSVIHCLRNDGTPLDRALAGVPDDWDLKTLWPERPDNDVQTVLLAMHDMAERFGQTLLGPSVEGILSDGMPLNSLAARMLYGRDDFRRMVRRQAAWHADLPRLDAALGAPADLAWPALFAPYAHPAHGIEIRCLTSAAELHAEGGTGPDAAGMAGLAHCVGGYAGACHEGRSHIAAVTGPGGTGRVRLATAEFVVEGGTFRIRQLRGRRNAAPSEEVLSAAISLLAQLDLGQHPHDPEAARTRAPSPPADPRPADLAAIYAAWRPHLPRAMRGVDLDGFRAIARGLAAGSLPPRRRT